MRFYLPTRSLVSMHPYVRWNTHCDASRTDIRHDDHSVKIERFLHNFWYAEAIPSLFEKRNTLRYNMLGAGKTIDLELFATMFVLLGNWNHAYKYKFQDVSRHKNNKTTRFLYYYIQNNCIQQQSFILNISIKFID